MDIKKPKLLIIGHARHGKDTFADLVVKQMDLSFISSSEFVGRVAIWEQWGKERYAAFSDMFEDRVNHRGLWYNLIVAYNTPNLARTGEEMMKDHVVYVGMRNPVVFYACTAKKLFDYVIWVDGSQRHPPESKDSNGITKDMADIWIDNNGPEHNLITAVTNLQERLHKEGFDVNYEDDTMRCNGNCGCEDGSECHEDVCGPNSRDTEHFQFDRPTLNEYISIINPPMVPNQGAKPPMITRSTPDNTLEDQREAHDEALKEAARREHNIAIMTTGWPEAGPQAPLILLPVEGTPKELRVGYQGETVSSESYDWAKTKPKVILDSLGGIQKHERTGLTWKDQPLNSTQVLDHGFFKVLEVMGSDQSIVDAARMSYGRGTKPVNSSAGLINYLVRNYHTSPLEMAEIRFHIRMPIFVMRQWVRHRTANLNEYSGRYSEMVRLFYVPDLERVCQQDTVNKQGSTDPLPPNEAELVRRSIRGISDEAFDEYETLLDMGVARETARIILPLNTYTEVVWKLDISNLIKFLRLRDDDHAQWEIRQYAKLVSDAVHQHFPLVFAAYKEVLKSQSLTEDEIYALITCNYDDLSASQAKKIADLREQIL